MASDKGVLRIVELFAAGFTIDDLRELKPKLKTHEFLQKAPKLHAVTVGVLREISAGKSGSSSDVVVSI